VRGEVRGGEVNRAIENGGLAAIAALVALVALAALAALAACQGEVTVSAAGRGDACDDLHCPMALGSQVGLVLTTEGYAKDDLYLVSREPDVLAVVRTELDDGALAWAIQALGAGSARLEVRTGRDVQLVAIDLTVAPPTRLGLAFESGASAERAFDPAQVVGPTASPGHDEAWQLRAQTQVTFLITPRDAADQPMLGDYAYSLQLAPELESVGDQDGPRVTLHATEAGTSEATLRIGSVSSDVLARELLFTAVE
jgi:hypothetical protein